VVTIQSAPVGAEVWLNGQQVGTTPMALQTGLTSSQNVLEFRLPGYESQRAELPLGAPQASTVTVTLVALQGQIEVQSAPPGAKVYLDDVPVGSAPMTVDEVATGTHRVRLVLADYAEWNQQVTVVTNNTAVVAGTMAGLPGTIEVRSTPADASVFVDGQERGITPLLLSGVPQGEHEVKVTKQGFSDWQQQLMVAPNAKVQAAATLLRKVEPLAYARPIAAMIDNHPNARPESGLAQADIVYEALAEGGITRFMGLFFTQPAEKIGPIRSARHYFVYWADEYNAMYTHCGGYEEAYAAIAATGIAEMDDMKGSPGFWRSSDREAPHNLYASTVGLRAEADRRGLKQDKGSTAGLLLSDDPKPAGQSASRMTLYYPYNYSVAWEYDPSQEDYRRFTAGAPHVDQATGQQLRGANVVVLFMRNWFMGGDDQQDFQITGSGRALFFLDGKVVEGTWTRASLDQPTYYWSAAGERVTLNRGGTTWIQVVPAGAKVTVE
jgi:hypothetical protein